MTWVAVNSASGYGPSITFDSTGATALFFAVSWHSLIDESDFTDSRGNTWLFVASSDNDAASSLLICSNPISVGPGHTLTIIAGVPQQMGLTVGWFSGGSNVAILNTGANSANSNVESLQPGELTPTGAGQLAISHLALRPLTDVPANTYGIDSSFTEFATTDAVQFAPPLGTPHYGSLLAYRINPALSALNPTNSWTGAVTAAASMIVVGSTGGTAALSGTILTATPADIIAGGKTIILTLTGDTWVASGATFNAQRQAIIDGLVSNSDAGNAFNAAVVPAIPVTNVVRTSDTVVTITLPAVPSYVVPAAGETIQATVPAASLFSNVTTTASPTFTIDAPATSTTVRGRRRRAHAYTRWGHPVTVTPPPPDEHPAWFALTSGGGTIVAVGESSEFPRTDKNVMTSNNAVNWTLRSSFASISWGAIVYNSGLFVAGGQNTAGADEFIGTSADGITWTLQTTGIEAQEPAVIGLAFGSSKYVALLNNRVTPGPMILTSPDAITWTERASAWDNQNGGQAVIFANNLFVALNTGSSDRVLTSSDGITWTARTAASANNWFDLAFGATLFVAVAGSGSGDRVMTSPDGITWTSRVSADDLDWTAVTFGNSIFVAVADDDVDDCVMTSPDGINWTLRTAFPLSWSDVKFDSGTSLFVAVAYDGIANQVMTSPDGINWTLRTSP